MLQWPHKMVDVWCNNFVGFFSTYVVDSLPDKCLNAIGPGPAVASQSYWVDWALTLGP